MGAGINDEKVIEEERQMIVCDGLCSMLDDLWGAVEDAGLFDIPVISNLISAVINLFWGLFGCDFW